MSTPLPSVPGALPAPVAIAAPPAALRRPRGAEMPLWLALAGGIVVTGAVLMAAAPFAGTYGGAVLLDRGPVQWITLLLAATVATFVAGRALRATRIARALRDVRRLPAVPDAPEPQAAAQVRDALIRAGTPVAVRRARALHAYAVSGRRSAAAAAAEDDAAHAEAEMDAGYAVPRTLVWAVPLMGFIGTVVGIGSAVAGFSGFLRQAEEIEQIKEGINAVTTGLAVAFDTTLLALSLSVLVMIPLVLAERREARLLRALEADVQDHVVARLPEGEAGPVGIDEAQVRAAVAAALEEALPSPEALVEPARHWFESGARALHEATRAAADELRAAAREVHEGGRLAQAALEGQATALRAQMEERDRAFLAGLQEAAGAIREAHAGTLRQFRAEAEASARRIDERLVAAAAALDETSGALRARVDALTALAGRVDDVAALQQSLAETYRGLEEANELRAVLAGVDRTLQGLGPALARLAQPRRIMLVEAEGAARTHAQG